MANNNNNRLILWADDDLDDLMIIRHLLDDLNYDLQLEEVHNGEQVLRFLKGLKPEEYPSLVILDINMPVVNGKEALIKLKADPMLSTINVIMFTTSNSKVDRDFCNGLGVEMITKPATVNALEQAIKTLVSSCI